MRLTTSAIVLFLLTGMAGHMVSPTTQAKGSESQRILVSVSRSKVERGQTVEVLAELRGNAEVHSVPLRAVVLRPTLGRADLTLKKAAGEDTRYRGQFQVGENAPAGAYAVHVWTVETAQIVGKANFRVGNIVADFFIAPYLDALNPAGDLDEYLRDFSTLGGNFLIAHNLITPAKAHYPSAIARTDVRRGSQSDLVELVLSRADEKGFGVLLSVSWDMTRESHFKDRMGEIKAIITELHTLYRHHPSLVGFYSYQEGSGTYFAAYAREFSQVVKSLDAGLLTACAPHVDDPLLAGYLSVIEELDMLIYQAGVMASYRPDNRKKYPHRRVRDFCALGAGAKRVQEKIALTHVELFAYLEKRQAPDLLAGSPSDIERQILSAATVTDTDGVAFFAYHAHIYGSRKKFPAAAERSHDAVASGMKAYQLITSGISRSRAALALYIPYSDWIIERWPNDFVPALDAFRVLGIPIDVLPYAPPLEESVYPYYPFHRNEAVLERLLRERTILVLANVSGFQQTDSDLIKGFVERGGVVIAFGVQIPMGRSYDRREVFGGDESGRARHSTVSVRSAIGKRVKTGVRLAMKTTVMPRWQPSGARVVARFEDGSAAVLTHEFGKGRVVTILPAAQSAAAQIPELVRDAIDYGLRATGRVPLLDIVGTNEEIDVAMSEESGRLRVAIVNHGESGLTLTIRLRREERGRRWMDLMSGERLPVARYFLKVRMDGPGVRVIEGSTLPETFRDSPASSLRN